MRASLLLVLVGTLLLAGSAGAASSASPLEGRWRGEVVAFDEGLAFNRHQLTMNLERIALGARAGTLDWPAGEKAGSCRDTLRLSKRTGPKRWLFTLAASKGNCAGLSWAYELTLLDNRRLRLYAWSWAAKFRTIEYRGVLIRRG